MSTRYSLVRSRQSEAETASGTTQYGEVDR